jgi:hypothetical protein
MEVIFEVHHAALTAEQRIDWDQALEIVLEFMDAALWIPIPAAAGAGHERSPPS